jgi:uncharacterized protein YuzE
VTEQETTKGRRRIIYCVPYEKKKREPIVNYDPSNDVLYLITHKGVEAEFKEIVPGVNVELDEEGQVIGVEILGASQILKMSWDPCTARKKPPETLDLIRRICER